MLDQNELIFLSDKTPYVLKNSVEEKINTLLYDAQQTILKAWEKEGDWFIPETASKVPGKVNKGNNHLGFPYQVFDFPSILQHHHLFAFRILIWYGNHFSFNLLLKGKYVSFFQPKVHQLGDHPNFLSLSESIWDSDNSAEKRLALNSSTVQTAIDYFEKNQSIRLFREFNMNQIIELNRLITDCFIDWFKK